MPIYKIQLGDTIKLVRAKNQSQAIRHVASKALTVSFADVEDMVKHREITVETAGEEPQASLDLEPSD